MATKTQGAITQLRTLYTHMITARRMDSIEQSYTARGEAFFHVSGAGHEGAAALAPFLIEDDWLHCHYRDKALMLARGVSPKQFFLALFNKDGSHSRGRQMNAHMSAPELKVMSIVGPVGNSALQSVGVAATVKTQEGDPIVLCSLGEGTTQEGEVIEAIGHAVREELPVLFVIQDNRFAISTKTEGQTFYSRPTGQAESFYGIPIRRIDGRDPVASQEAFGTVVEAMREDRRPRIVVFEVERLHNHTNADDQRMYRSESEIRAAAESGDPIVRLRSHLIDTGITAADLDAEEAQIVDQLEATAREVQRSPEPKAFHGAKAPLPAKLSDPAGEYRGTGEAEITMLEAIREVLDARLAADERVTLFGEDLEDPKGDVFGITRGLTQKYGARVKNSPLSESLILGVSVGRALTGERPVAFLQFADFLPIAYNQIFAELGSMYWRSDGRWSCPVIVMVTAGGYRPGLGPFHASTLEALVAHTPGVDVVMPSTASDAAGLLNAAFESERPTVFFYPKNQLNDRATATSRDVKRQLVPLGRARRVMVGDDLTIVGWGNTVPLAVKAAKVLADHDVSVDVLDLRSLVPWDRATVIESAERTGRLIVAHEDNHTAGFGAEVLATVLEGASCRIEARRVTRPDTFVPCNFGNQLEILPSYKRILETAVHLLAGTLTWKKDAVTDSGTFPVEAVGASPSDETITMVEWTVAVGDEVEEGDLLAEVEADKAAAQLKSPVAGRVSELLIEAGDAVAVGTPIVTIATAGDGAAHPKQPTREDPGTALISGLRTVRSTDRAQSPDDRAAAAACYISGVSVRKGSRIVENEEIVKLSPSWDAEGISKRTGIERRPWIADGETVLTLALDATFDLFAKMEVDPREVSNVLFATGTPNSTTPSMAALVHYHLSERFGEFESAAFDINAACAGYLYGLQIAHDYLRARPGEIVLLITSEVLSPRLNMNDAGTAPIFADAATATLLGGTTSKIATMAQAEVLSPIASAKGESGESLCVPLEAEDPVTMDGPKVYLEAVHAMIESLRASAEMTGLEANGLDRYIPHQANQRIINAVRQRIGVTRERMHSNIAENGNTSSSTIPICLAELLPDREPGQTWGLTAFGGGFTFGACILKTL